MSVVFFMIKNFMKVNKNRKTRQYHFCVLTGLLPCKDSNPDIQSQNLTYYHYTTGQNERTKYKAQNTWHKFKLIFLYLLLVPLFVGPWGFEPQQTEPKSVVLPLHNGPKKECKNTVWILCTQKVFKSFQNKLLTYRKNFSFF